MVRPCASRPPPPRPEKRHLVRWSDSLDKKLLLCIQSVCNVDGVAIPWDKIGLAMSGPTTGGPITGGAIIQHLAKTRVRMVQQGLSVPPPLKRGGTIRITTTSNARAPNSNRTPNAVSTGDVSPVSVVQVSLPRTSKRINKKARKSASDNDDDTEEEDDTDEEWGMPTATRSNDSRKNKGKGAVKQDDSEGESDDDAFESSSVGEKRKRGAKSSKSSKAKRTIKGSDENSDLSSVGEGDGYVDSNAAFFTTESPVAKSPNVRQTGLKTLPKKSNVITLKWGKAFKGLPKVYAQSKLMQLGVIASNGAIYSDSSNSEDDNGDDNDDDGDNPNVGSFLIDAAGNKIQPMGTNAFVNNTTGTSLDDALPQNQTTTMLFGLESPFNQGQSNLFKGFGCSNDFSGQLNDGPANNFHLGNFNNDTHFGLSQPGSFGSMPSTSMQMDFHQNNFPSFGMPGFSDVNMNNGSMNNLNSTNHAAFMGNNAVDNKQGQACVFSTNDSTQNGSFSPFDFSAPLPASITASVQQQPIQPSPHQKEALSTSNKDNKDNKTKKSPKPKLPTTMSTSYDPIFSEYTAGLLDGEDLLDADESFFGNALGDHLFEDGDGIFNP